MLPVDTGKLGTDMHKTITQDKLLYMYTCNQISNSNDAKTVRMEAIKRTPLKADPGSIALLSPTQPWYFLPVLAVDIAFSNNWDHVSTRIKMLCKTLLTNELSKFNDAKTVRAEVSHCLSRETLGYTLSLPEQNQCTLKLHRSWKSANKWPTQWQNVLAVFLLQHNWQGKTENCNFRPLLSNILFRLPTQWLLVRFPTLFRVFRLPVWINQSAQMYIDKYLGWRPKTTR